MAFQHHLTCKMFLNTRLYFTAIVTVSIWTLLLWSHFHGGVPKHHLLANEQLPAISNWWGGLLLPLLTWFLLYRIQIRIKQQVTQGHDGSGYLKQIFYGFACSMGFGIVLSIFFTFGQPDICGYMMLALLPLGLLIPIYRAECLLGFVFGMTFTFGTVLPTGIGAILVLVGALLYLVIRSGILFIVSKVVRKPLPDR